MAKMRKDRGFSLIELIVIIAVMSILTGVAAPTFLQQASKKREQTCVQNRDALLNIYEKGVYGGNLEVETSDLNLLVNATGADDQNELFVQAHRFTTCPDGGTFTAYVADDGNAYIICDHHEEEVCMADFIGWTGSGTPESADIPYDIPEDVPYTPSGPEPIPQDPPQQPPVNTINGVWPYKTDVNGNEDPRWTNARTDAGDRHGIDQNASVFILLPKYAHFIASQSGKEYVIVQGNRTENGNSYFSVKYQYSEGPETAAQDGSGDLTWVIPASGKVYDNKNNPPEYASPTNHGQIRLSRGDKLVIYYTENGVEKNKTFIARTGVNQLYNMLSEDTAKTAVYGTNYGELYVVPEMASTIDPRDFY